MTNYDKQETQKIRKEIYKHRRNSLGTYPDEYIEEVIETKNDASSFPFEMLAQIYNQRLQILWFAIVISLALLGAFYKAFFDAYAGDHNMIPLFMVGIALCITAIIHMLECRNRQMQKHIEDGLKKISPSLYKNIHAKSGWFLSYQTLIDFIFFLLYFIEGICFGFYSYLMSEEFISTSLFEKIPDPAFFSSPILLFGASIILHIIRKVKKKKLKYFLGFLIIPPPHMIEPRKTILYNLILDFFHSIEKILYVSLAIFILYYGYSYGYLFSENNKFENFPPKSHIQIIEQKKSLLNNDVYLIDGIHFKEYKILQRLSEKEDIDETPKNIIESLERKGLIHLKENKYTITERGRKMERRIRKFLEG